MHRANVRFGWKVDVEASAKGGHSLRVRLYLTSYHMGNDADRLLSLAGHHARVGIISNALDYIPADARKAYRNNGGFTADDWFRQRGLAVSELDLRAYFKRPAQLERALECIDLVWAVGGNAFLLLRAMRQSGFEHVLKRRLAADSLMYGGWSAGACVAGSSLQGIHLMDEPERLADGYEPEPLCAGLGLIDQVIVPHFASDHPEASGAARAAEYLEVSGVPFLTLRDGETIIVNS